jgi:hypothetical protein
VDEQGVLENESLLSTLDRETNFSIIYVDDGFCGP